MRASRMRKFVAEVSSSRRRQVAPTSSASMIAAACDVDPLALLVENRRVSTPPGSRSMKLEISVPATERPLSACTATAPGTVTTRSRPSPGMWSYTPRRIASRSVDFPWYPPPTISVTPLGMPIPVTGPALGAVSVTRRSGGERKGLARSVGRGRSSIPETRGRMAPSAMKATSPRGASWSRSARASSTVSTCSRNWSSSSASKNSPSATAAGTSSVSSSAA